MTEKLTARQVFKKVYNGQKNFMTPNIVKYFQTKYHAIEISQGRGISNQNIYGVSVIDLDTLERCQHSGNLYQSLTSALYAAGRIKDYDRQKSNRIKLWCTYPARPTESLTSTDNPES